MFAAATPPCEQLAQACCELGHLSMRACKDCCQVSTSFLCPKPHVQAVTKPEQYLIDACGLDAAVS